MTCFNQQRWKKTPSGYQVPFLSMKGNKGTWWSPFQKKSMIRKKKGTWWSPTVFIIDDKEKNVPFFSMKG